MTCGIYILKFNGTNKVYVGQSVHIEKRYREHLVNLKGQKAVSKLQEAYNKYNIPLLEVLIECTTEELDNAEEEAISIYNSVSNGFNTYAYANQAPINKGYGFGNSKYTKESILHVVELLASDKVLSDLDISKITGVNKSTVNQLANTATHQWVWDDNPDLYNSVQKKLIIKAASGRQVVSNKLCAYATGKTYPPILSPDGVTYNITNAYKFAKELGLAPNHFQEVLNGHRKTHKGWKLA